MEICCKRKSRVLFCLEFLNCRTQSTLSWFQDFENTCCMYLIVYLTPWSLSGVSLLINCLFLIWCIEIGGVLLFGADTKHNKCDIKACNTSYCLFYDTLWRISSALINFLFHFVLIFSTATPNRRYPDSKTLNIIIGCIVLLIPVCGA